MQQNITAVLPCKHRHQKTLAKKGRNVWMLLSCDFCDYLRCFNLYLFTCFFLFNNSSFYNNPFVAYLYFMYINTIENIGTENTKGGKLIIQKIVLTI